MSGLGQDGTDPDDFNRGDGDPEIGKELTEFFLHLLKDGKALKQYYDRGTDDDGVTRRELLIRDYRFNTRAGEILLEKDSLKAIEEHILAVPGSYAKPLVIVWPAM
jgi:hypothetical protein